MIEITTIAEYDYLISRGYFPLQDWRLFKMPIDLRLEIQYSIFGNLDIEAQNNRFYQLFYKHSLKHCEETGQPIYEKHAVNRRNVFSAENVSHIISKGSDRRMALDFRNANLLIKPIHDIWEFGTQQQKSGLKIWPKNKLIINILKADYNL